MEETETPSQAALRLIDDALAQIEQLADYLGVELRNDRRKPIHYDA
jgi:hypothetical protein